MHGVDPNASDFRSQVLDKLRIEFERTPNPMLPWSALRWARDGGLDIPRWIIDHLYDKAVVLSKIIADDVGKEAEEVGRALGFGAAGKGAATAGAELRQHWRDWKTAVRIADGMRQGLAKDAAVAAAAETLSISSATAYRAHAKYGSEAAAQFVESMSKVHE
jgi:hypothetical protein